jgi:Flp pilus assembly protein TadD
MHPKFPRQTSPVRRLAPAAACLMLAVGLWGCQTSGPSDITGSLGEKADVKASDPRRDLDTYRTRFKANPKDADAALKYGKALRSTGQKSQAVAVLEQASMANPGNMPLLAGYGRALADNGNFQQAFDVLARAHKPEDPDWTILSAQGATLDQLGRFDEARQYYASALKIVPDEPSVLCNLGLSYVLSKDLAKADEALRRAYSLAGSDPRIRANRALVLGLQGRMNEAETIAKADLPPAEGAANVTALKQMLARKQASSGEKMPVASTRQTD